jgi:arylsulfatase A
MVLQRPREAARAGLIFGLSVCLLAASCQAPARSETTDGPPNVVVILADDMGWGDLESQGATGFSTPQLTRLASEGTRFQSGYVPQSVCTPSRAALLTGCYPMRLGLGQRVLFPYSTHGLNPSEETLAESLSGRGYKTACIGKWHLGHFPEFLPLSQGFDEYFGIPYSNDMDAHHYSHNDFQAPGLALYRNEEVIERSPDQSQFTKRCTDAAIDFMERHKDERFFLYLAHPMPHQPIHASEPWVGSSELGLYGDVLQELDDSVGRILDALTALDLEKETLVVFTSDNGPWRRESTGGLRGRKNTTWEGGVRVPLIFRLPGRIPAGRTSRAPFAFMDLKPSVEALAGGISSAPNDGRDLSAHLAGGPDPEEHVLAFYKDQRLQALRRGRWKLHVHRPEWGGQVHPPLLFDLDADPGESKDLAATEPSVVARMLEDSARIRVDLGDVARGVRGNGIREAGQHVVQPPGEAASDS